MPPVQRNISEAALARETEAVMAGWMLLALLCFVAVVGVRGQPLSGLAGALSAVGQDGLTTAKSGSSKKYTAKPTEAPPTKKGQPPKGDLGKKFVLTSEQKSILKGNCAKKSGRCKGQSDKAKKVKDHVKKALAEDLIKGGKITNPLQAAAKVTATLDAVKEAKKAMYDTAGLDGIDPDEDGLWQMDMQLNLEQAQYILKEVTGLNTQPGALTKTLLGGKNKRFSIFMESFPASKWKLPITYAIGSDVSYSQASQVRAAVAEIQRKTCIRFREDTSGAPATPYILYRPYTSGSFCGQSPLGNQGGVNTVWLNFNCDGGYIKATIIHETMHSLGCHHEHVRVDRDEFITVDWNNINPQSYDLFDGRPYVNSYTTYGVANMYAGQASMIPKLYPGTFTKIIGQRYGMSDRDAEKLRKMYCLDDCNDYHVWCGFWALQKQCMNSEYFSYMKSTCPKSCGFCPEGATT